MKLHPCLILIGTAACLALACDQNKSGETTTTGATVTPTVNNAETATPRDTTPTAGLLDTDPNDSAIDRITSARCAREFACNRVGSGKKWTDDNACRRETRQNVRGDYNSTECHVIQSDKLQSCVDAIRDEKCDTLIGPDFGVCRRGNICSE